MIIRMLTNEQYTGSYVSGKHELKKIGSGARIDKDRSEWIVIPNSHPAIIGKDDFERAQKMLKSPKESTPAQPIPSDYSNASRPRIASGERVSSAVPYGYVKAENGEWEADETAAKVVQGIFEMAAQGLTVREICDKLYASNQPTPAEHFKLARGHDIQPTSLWPKLRVSEILKDEQYIGTYIAGKSFQDSYGKKYRNPKSEWIMIPGKHLALVSKEVFEKVQAIRASSRKNMQRREYLLHGKVSCGCCGFALVYNDSTNPATYRCMHTHQNTDADCHKMKISADELDGVVLALIRKQAEVVLNSDDLSGIRKISVERRRIADYEKEAEVCVERRQEAYERFVLREIDSEAYQTVMKDISARLDNLNSQIAAFKQAERDREDGKKTIAIAKHTLSEAAKPREIVEALVDKILVFPGKRVEIQWKFADFAKLG
jgi:hypothetical protein